MVACNRQHGLTDKEFEVDDINAVFGTPECRWFRVQWAGYKNQDTWEPERSLRRQGCEEAIRDFWTKDTHSPHEGFIADPDGVWRCYQCGKGYQHERTLKSHITRTHTKRQWRGSTLDKDTRMMQQKQLQQKKAKVNCEGEELENVWTFKSLGSQLRADGDHMHDVRVRMAIAERTAGTLRHVWSARAVPLQLKLRIYKSGVCSRLTYGSEAWHLTSQVQKALNGCNSRMLSHVTGRTVHDETSKETRTRTYDVVAVIRAVRTKEWLGHILRMQPTRMVSKVVQHMYSNRHEGDLLMDAPNTETWEELCSMVMQRTKWRQFVEMIKMGREPRWRANLTSVVMNISTSANTMLSAAAGNSKRQ